eukprot:TRINITY_DN1477_c0_g1_i1.p1 TRINITY_DN1477_c0_g1~~TRINITY_DN1477_c0_g1_i1.p1  ORF type:complete len:247 (+),score=62.32 TRINITY_DN1477_c0_g1_i1:580-1320(+)
MTGFPLLFSSSPNLRLLDLRIDGPFAFHSIFFFHFGVFTIGVDFLEKEHFVSKLGENVTMMLWDTAGQEEFDSITRTYYRGAGACVIGFSTTDRQSFLDVEKWKRKVEAECPDIPMILVQNKIDLLDQATVQKEEAEELSNRLGLKFYRICVKENMNVNQVFEDLAEMYVKKGSLMSGAEAQSIGSLSTKKSTTSTPSGSAVSHATPNTTAAQSTTAVETNQAFSLQKPSKQRTGGKKAFLKCSIL